MATSGRYDHAPLSSVEQFNFPDWSNGEGLTFTDLAGDLSTSAAGAFSWPSPEDEDLSNPFSSATRYGIGIDAAAYNANNATLWDSGISGLSGPHTVDKGPQAVPNSTAHVPRAQTEQFQGHDASPQTHSNSSVHSDQQSVRLTEDHPKIAPPPAALLMGGSWRHLHQHFCVISEKSRAVESAFVCVTELLAMEEGGPQKENMKPIYDRHQRACNEIRTKLTSQGNPRPGTSERLLVAIFLLAWFEVIRDLETDQSLFPRDLAESVVSSQSSWSRTSEELLSWLAVLDSKSTHLGGQHLLSDRALEIVRHYPVRITSPSTWDNFDWRRGGPRPNPDGSPFTASSPGSKEPHLNLSRRQQPVLVVEKASVNLVQVKQAFLHAVLDPALQWHLHTQLYWRRLSAHHSHHRNRSTTEDEYEVITACKQAETELFELWHFRPAIISMTAQQLGQIVPSDLATKLEEVFSIYLANFWILFVYLHRVSWWNLPQSELARRTLAETWRQLQRAYGEEMVVDGTAKKRGAHPSLQWLLFVFGCECSEKSQRKWAIEQLETLGEARPVVEAEDPSIDMLFPLGSTHARPVRNIKRVAALLTKVTEEQDRLKMRADVRAISMEMFGYHISIV